MPHSAGCVNRCICRGWNLSVIAACGAKVATLDISALLPTWDIGLPFPLDFMQSLTAVGPWTEQYFGWDWASQWFGTLGLSLDCDLTGSTVVQGLGLQSLAADEANVRNGLHTGLQPSPRNICKVQPHVDLLQHPGGCLRHVAIDAANHERIVVDPASARDQLGFFTSRAKAKNVALVSIDSIGSQISESVVVLIKRRSRGVRIATSHLRFMVEDTLHHLFTAAASRTCPDDVCLACRWKILDLCHDLRAHA